VVGDKGTCIGRERSAACTDDSTLVFQLTATPLPLEDLVVFVWSNHIAGLNTTRDAIGSALLTMLSDRKHWTRACVDPDIILSCSKRRCAGTHRIAGSSGTPRRSADAFFRGLQRLDVVWNPAASGRS
jgi:hypothetical protein